MVRMIRRLTIYYGFLQIAHLLVLANGLIFYIRSGTIGFPAPPPAGGWGDQTIFFLLGNGLLDAFIAIAALFYIGGYLKGKAWSEGLGLICVTASLCSGIFFIIGTSLSGAWVSNLVNYGGLLLVFTPVVALFFGLSRVVLMRDTT